MFSWNPLARWQQNRLLQHELSEADIRNPNYQTFKGVNNDIERIVAARSIISQKIQLTDPIANPIWQTFGFDSDMVMMPVATNKADRMIQYRKIAMFPEASWCISEIADEFIHTDEFGNYINLTLPEGKDNLNKTRQEILQDEFKRYINLFRLRDEGYNYIKRFIVEGELAWENVIKPDVPSMGIVGVRFLMPEYYETLLDTKTNRPVGLLFDVERFAMDTREILSNNYLGAASVFNNIIPTTASFTLTNRNAVPMLWSQLTYINSGETTLDGNQYISLPLIDRTKQAYYQLALLYDAAVILRVTRAPERLLFNISTGKMNDNYAQQYVRDFANSLKAKKVTLPNGPKGSLPDVASVYNPVSMIENFVFGRSDGNDGTSIESVGSSANYEQMDDIKFFLRRFMKQFKVPFARFETPENAPPALDQLSYEEHSFLKMVVRLLRRFAVGFKNGFIVDLKLKGIWDKYELKDEDIQIEFVKPGTYDLYEVQQAVEAKMNIYKAALGDNDEFSKTFAMKKFLGFTDADIKENAECLIKDKMMAELAEYYGGQVAEKHGLAGWESPIKFKDDELAEQKEKAEGSDSEEGSEEGSEEENSEESSNEEEPSENSEETSNEESSEGSQEENTEEQKEEAPSFGLK